MPSMTRTYIELTLHFVSQYTLPMVDLQFDQGDVWISGGLGSKRTDTVVEESNNLWAGLGKSCLALCQKGHHICAI